MAGAGDAVFACALAMHVCQAGSVRLSSKIYLSTTLTLSQTTHQHQPLPKASRSSVRSFLLYVDSQLLIIHRNLFRRAKAVNLYHQTLQTHQHIHTMADDSSAAWPQADQQLSQEILDLVSFFTISKARTMQSAILVIGRVFPTTLDSSVHCGPFGNTWPNNQNARPHSSSHIKKMTLGAN
jgi:hypothetical protein